jgi:DNA-binding Lrp family transcriptional regulator
MGWWVQSRHSCSSSPANHRSTPASRKDIIDITGVQQAQAVAGPYDVIVRAEARNIDELGQLVVARVQAVAGITRTLTCPVAQTAGIRRSTADHHAAVVTYRSSQVGRPRSAEDPDGKVG